MRLPAIVKISPHEDLHLRQGAASPALWGILKAFLLTNFGLRYEINTEWATLFLRETDILSRDMSAATSTTGALGLITMSVNPEPIPDRATYIEELAHRAIRGNVPKHLVVDAEEFKKCKGAIDLKPMVELLENNPQLQEQLAFFLDYTPSKWLLSAEIPAVIARRKKHDFPDDGFTAKDDPYEWASKHRLQGLCLSGGGIRSATFNLGVLQGLAQLGMLPKFDYLSSVSGGGYIHEWLAAWIKREDCQFSTMKTPAEAGEAPVAAKGNKAAPSPLTTIPPSFPPLPESKENPPSTGLGNVQARLRPLPAGKEFPFSAEPIRWLRRYSNYLTPQIGFFTADTWVAFAIWLRNTFLNQTILVSFLFFLVLMAYLVRDGHTALTHLLRQIPKLRDLDVYLAGEMLLHHLCFWTTGAILLFTIGSVMMWLMLFCEHTRIRHFDLYGVPSKNKMARLGGERVVLLSVIVPFILASFALTHALVLGITQKQLIHILGPALIIFIAGLALTGGVISSYKANHALCSNYLPSIGEHPGRRAILWDKTTLFLKGTLKYFRRLKKSNRGVRSDAENQAYVGWRVFVSAILVASFGTGLIAAMGGVALCLLVAGILQFPNFQHASLTMHYPAWLVVKDVHVIPWSMQLTLGPPLLLFVPFFSLVLAAGLVGRNYPDWLREWIARVRAWCMLFGLAWILYFGIALVGPVLVECLGNATHYRTMLASIKWSALLGWIATTVGSVLAANSKKSTGTEQDRSTVLNMLAEVGPYVFIVGLLLLLSNVARFAWDKMAIHPWGPLLLFFVPIAIFLLFGWRVDVNEFSMNSFYRNRLTRCYLGATNGERDPNPLTGFDDRDTRGLQIACLQPSAGYSGPLPIINTTLNLSFGEDLAWQERKAASFFFSPIFSGYTVGWTAGKAGKAGKESLSFNGFVPTASYYTPKGGINISTAVAISGAAASPNWGFHTNPATAFLMTLFNVRLGWWIFNPRRSHVAGHLPCTAAKRIPEWPSPHFAPLQLGRELFGAADDTSKYVYLSDGGHFDNMGLYELVRRRCYRIVICDAESDENYIFEGLGMAIRKCRIDFGVEIDMEGIALLREKIKTGICKAHFAQGTIRYPETPNEPSALGRILYIKSSLTANATYEANPKASPREITSLESEPLDILNYKFQHHSFPHDTTANQWFTESQFESYRRLGQHVVEEVQCCKGWINFN